MATDPAALSLEEYRALRATIRARGNLRFIAVIVTFSVWAGLALLVNTQLATPALVVIPLVALAAGFEVVYALHVGTERIGRYLQVYYESVTGVTPAWEHLAMAIGQNQTAAPLNLDPLFSALFGAATVLNLMPAALDGSLYDGWPVELIGFGAIHALFIVRVFRARRIARQQRAKDLAFFERQRHS